MKLSIYKKDNETHYRLMFTDVEKARYNLSYWEYDTINRSDIGDSISECLRVDGFQVNGILKPI